MSARPTAIVHNPLLALPSAQRVLEFPPDAREAMRAVLLDLSAEARERAQHSWITNKAPMAAYWKMCAVYARHLARLCRRDTSAEEGGNP